MITLRNGERVELIRQDDPELAELEGFDQWGCRARVLIAIAEYASRVKLEGGQIVELVRWGLHQPDVLFKGQRGGKQISYEAGSREHLLIDKAFEVAGSKLRGAQLGSMEPATGTARFWGWVHTVWSEPDWQYMLREWRTTGAFGLHWVLADRAGKELFDPYRGDWSSKGVSREMLYGVWRDEKGGV